MNTSSTFRQVLACLSRVCGLLAVFAFASYGFAQPYPGAPTSDSFRFIQGPSLAQPPTQVSPGQAYMVLSECYTSSHTGIGPSTSGAFASNFYLQKDGVTVSGPEGWGYAESWSGSDQSGTHNFDAYGNGHYIGRWTVTVVNPTATVTTSSNPSNGGTTSGGGTFTVGNSVTVTASQASGGWTFRNWTENGGQVSVSTSYSFTLTGNRALVANFNPPQTHVLTPGRTGSGTITPGITTSYLDGTGVTVTAYPAAGYYLSSWSGSAAPGGIPLSFTVTMSGNKDITANFSPYSYTLATSTIGSGSVSGGGTYSYGANPTITAWATIAWPMLSSAIPGNAAMI